MKTTRWYPTPATYNSRPVLPPAVTYHHLDPEALPATADYPCDRRDLGDAAGYVMTR